MTKLNKEETKCTCNPPMNEETISSIGHFLDCPYKEPTRVGALHTQDITPPQEDIDRGVGILCAKEEETEEYEEKYCPNCKLNFKGIGIDSICPECKTEFKIVTIAKSWEELKKGLLATQTEFEDRNGLDYCKNCGTDFKELIKDIDLLFQQQKEEIENKLLHQKECIFLGIQKEFIKKVINTIKN